MKFAPLIGLLLVTTVTVLGVEATVDYLRAKSNGSTVTLEWRSSNEGNVVNYEIERAGPDQVFRSIGSVAAKGSNQAYTYTDEEAFGKNDDATVSSTYFTYRLKLVGSDQSSSYSATASVSHTVSSIKRTWGMIKEMFR
jgi:hypothetical protein